MSVAPFVPEMSDVTVRTELEPLLIGKREAAKLLNISERTLTTHTQSGLIPSITLEGRRLYPLEELRLWIKQRLDAESGKPG